MAAPGGSTQPFPPDAELIARLRERDDSVFVLLVDGWSGGMRRVARSFVSTNDSAVEVVQEAWLAVIENIETFEGRSSLKTWVFRILVNAAKRRGKREGRVIPLSSLGPEDMGPTVDPGRFRGPDNQYPGDWWDYPAEWPSPEQEALAGEIRSEVAAALEQLPDRQRIVITLRDLEGHTSDEVCSILEITAANQRVLLHRARAFVRGRLEQYFTGGERTHGGGGMITRWTR